VDLSKYQYVNASYNYWGHDTGPEDPFENPDGKGDLVTPYVYYEPWLDRQMKIYKSSDGDDSSLYIILILLITIPALIAVAILILRKTDIRIVSSIHASSSTPSSSGSRSPSPTSKKAQKSSETYDHTDSTHEVPIIHCQYCSGTIEIKPNDISIRVKCPHCSRSTLHDRFKAGDINEVEKDNSNDLRPGNDEE